ncbi:furin-like protease kpc-1 isoform X2 [Dreissena polymorpha]|uniref:furin-like protease kpc-1 isoform X2 n=1 Tax=Dreissena polymorpha TaxID=45954 RepID=UPI00226430C0|nr:furin-like protease kpc-1 isoform X2 [Dreissena polymorpha]
MSYDIGQIGILVVIFTLILACGNGGVSDDDYTDLYSVHMDAKHADYVTEYLENVGFEFQHKVADYYIFKDVESQSSTSIAVIRSKIKMKIRSMKRVRKQYLSYEPDAGNSEKTRSSKILHMKKGGAAPGRKIIMCAPYYDALQGIDEAWKLGYTGKGVVVAVTDTGFTVDHPELSPNINLELSKNFVQNDTSDLSPGDNREYMLSHVNHGNDCASVIAGVHNNNLCGTGVAHNATLAVLKIGRLIEVRNKYIFDTDETKYGEGLIHKCSEIDIYSNSWGASVGPLGSCSFIKEILNMGTQQGRGSKGSIYVFPSGRVGDCLTSSIYTITVGGLNYDRSLPGNSVQSSATLASAFSGQNSSFSDKKMVTAFLRHDKPCTNSFGGTSAATAVVAGITALVLQANSNLTWRDVQHVLVQSALNCCLENFRLNAAGHYCSLVSCAESRDVVTDIKLVIYGTGTKGNDTEDNAATTDSGADDFSPVNDHPQSNSWSVIVVLVLSVVFVFAGIVM